MRFLPLLVLTAIFLTACSPSGSEPVPQAKVPDSNAPVIVADTVYTNGKIYTVNEAQSWAEAVAIKNGKFLVVGSNADVEAVTDENTITVDLGGRMAMPGMIDVHNHATGAANSKANLYINTPTDKNAMLAEIRAYAEANPDVPFIRGEAWNMGVFPANSPRKEWLDEIDSNRPIYLYDQSGHAAWVNSKTLDLIGVDADFEQTVKFVVDVDPNTNEPTGTIREYAMAAVEQVLDPIEPNRLAPALHDMMATFSRNGWTALKLAEGEVPWTKAANLLDEQGDLNVRLFPSWFHRAHVSAMSAETSRDVATRWEEFVSPMVYPRYVKIYADGTPGSHTILLDEDYSDRPGDKGDTTMSTEDMIEEFTFFNSKGLGLIVHVFGDATSREVIKAFEVVRERNGDNGIPMHLSHSVMTQPAEIERLAKISDVCMDLLTIPYRHPAIESGFVPPIGDERYEQFLNTKVAADSGIPFSFGSDWPSSLEQNPNGFFTMQAMVTRRDPNNPEYGALNEGQAITLEQAVKAITYGGAQCLGFDWPEKLGSIEAGKMADFIVVDQNIFEVPIEKVNKTNVDLTIVGGEVVYSRD